MLLLMKEIFLNYKPKREIKLDFKILNSHLDQELIHLMEIKQIKTLKILIVKVDNKN